MRKHHDEPWATKRYWSVSMREAKSAKAVRRIEFKGEAWAWILAFVYAIALIMAIFYIGMAIGSFFGS